jgi:hypothetical protein
MSGIPFFTSATRTWVFLILLLIAGCKTSRPGKDNPSTLQTDDTRAAILKTCEQIEPEGSSEILMKDACDCMRRRVLPADLRQTATRFCGGAGAAWMNHLKETSHAEAILVMQDDQGSPANAEQMQCAHELAETHREFALEDIVDACREGSDDALRVRITIPDKARRGTCWRLTNMDRDNCVMARPCTGRGPAKLSALPLAPAQLARLDQNQSVAEGATVTLCNADIQTMHRLKDPQQINHNSNWSFANLLTFNRGARHVTYGAANCHGTAQALAGNILSGQAVQGLSWHSPRVETDCKSFAEQAWKDGTEKARTRGESMPTMNDLPIQLGGVIINMVHDESCRADDCGRTSFHTTSCVNGTLESHVFFRDMCVNCWDKALEDSGFKRLHEKATWKDLTRHCILTTNDHSITVTHVNDGLCFYYESLAPHAAPQINVMECPRLLAKFPKRWCREEPFPWFIKDGVLSGENPAGARWRTDHLAADVPSDVPGHQDLP